tara:strand:+ start:195 stop:848 length:654 start_codon:yes stop_codon:yes gene_type:complete
MTQENQKIIINIEDSKFTNWQLCLKSKLKILRSNYIEINCKNLSLSCTEILEIIEISTQYNCKIICFSSTSPMTIVSCQSLGYEAQFLVHNHSGNTLKTNDRNLTFSKTHFHQGTLRSGEYLESPGDLLILGDVNPGAKVSAEGNIIIWGRLLGIAHAGSKGDTEATISALQLRPVQLRIAEKVARGPEEKTQLGLAERAIISSNSKEIVITPLESI